MIFANAAKKFLIINYKLDKPRSTLMQILFWKKNRLIDNFANTLANDLFSSLQPDAALEFASNSKKKNKKADAKIARKLDDLILRVKQFRNEHSIGVYGKARLHLKFANRLVELGYQEHVAKKINEMILLSTP